MSRFKQLNIILGKFLQGLTWPGCQRSANTHSLTVVQNLFTFEIGGNFYEWYTVVFCGISGW